MSEKRIQPIIKIFNQHNIGKYLIKLAMKTCKIQKNFKFRIQLKNSRNGLKFVKDIEMYEKVLCEANKNVQEINFGFPKIFVLNFKSIVLLYEQMF